MTKRSATSATALGLTSATFFLLLVCLPSERSVVAQESTVTKSATETTAADEKDPIKKHNFWMDQKLRLSKDMLTGLSMADFDQIGKSAEIMRGLNRLETFVRRSPEGYRENLAQFNMANKALIRAAQDENLEGATLAFNQMTVSCVSCHKNLREQTAKSEK